MAARVGDLARAVVEEKVDVHREMATDLLATAIAHHEKAMATAAPIDLDVQQPKNNVED